MPVCCVTWTRIIIPASKPIVLKSTDSIASSCPKPAAKMTTIAAPRSATFVRWRRSVAITAGIGLALLDVIDVDPGDREVIYLIELALVLTLFSDGLFVERELLRM